MGEKTLHSRKPDINNLYKVLRKEEPERPVLFEIFMNMPLYERLAGREMPQKGDSGFEQLKIMTEAYLAAGYDYVSAWAADFGFPIKERDSKKTLSLNKGFVITDEESFKAYKWPDPYALDYSRLEKIRPFLPEDVKLMCMSPGGVLENVIRLTGYDNLCLMLYDNPDLVKMIFDEVGKRFLGYFEMALEYDTVGLILSSDDWGFKTQTFLSPDDMRKYLFPWHKQYVDLAHRKGIPAVLHSCGCFRDVMEDTYSYIGFDGKHSYEDAILPVEEFYEKWQGKIAIMGGIDVDFLVNHEEGEITERARAMLRRSESRGGYALGTGNSVPEYIPQEHYLAMIKAALEY
jgi:uroporphyrinogen decarboxylase